MELKSFSEFLFEAKKKKDDIEVDVTKPQQAYYKDLPKSTAQKKKAQISKQAEMPSDDPSAYKELPGDKKAREQGKVKTSKYTKKYHQMYGEELEEGVMSNIALMADASKDFEDFKKKFKKDYKKVFQNTPDFMDWLYNMYKDMAPLKAGERVEEAKQDDGKPDEKLLNEGPIKNPDIEKALKKKQEDTGVDIKILRAVMRKGMAAWKAGHRPGATQEQWGYARVNSFLTKGKTVGTNSDPGPDYRLAKMAKIL